MMEGLRTPTELVVIVVILLAYGCPVQAIVHAYGLDERTVAEWQKRAGKHCQHVHERIVEQGKVTTSHVQADEIRAKGRTLVIWMGMAIDAMSRLWMAGVVRVDRDRQLADRFLLQVLSLRARSVDLHRWLECVPKQLHAGLARKSEKDGWERTMLFGSVARSLYCHDHQAYEEKTGGRSHASPDTRTHGESASPPAENSRLSAVQYLLDRTLQCHDAGTAGFSRPKMSSRRSSSADLGDRNVFDWMHLQFLLAPSGVEHDETLRAALYACDGSRTHRLYLECL